MRKTNLLIYTILFISLILSGFQCSSTELTSARLYIQQKNYEKAISVLTSEVQKNPKSDEGWYLMGYTYGEMGIMDSMVNAYDKSLAISNKFEKDITDSRIYFWANKFNSGVNLFQRGNKTDNEDSSKIFYDKSIEAFNQATMLEPDSADNYKNLAFVYMSSGRNEEAIEPLEKLVQLNKELDGYKYLGEIYFSLGTQKKSSFQMSGNTQDSIDAMMEFNKSIAVLEEGSKLYPDDGDILRTLSAAYIEVGEEDIALSSLKSLVDREPENKIYRYNYGVLLLQTQDYPAAAEQFKKALDIDPEYENAIYNLGVTYINWGKQLKQLEEETEQYSDEDVEKFKNALPYMEKITTQEPDNAQMWELLGQVYSILGMQQEAMDAFKKADQLR
ncbi:MAG: tetratricopeptide repeat protein [Ignavibacteriaceae bacterium]